MKYFPPQKSERERMFLSFFRFLTDMISLKDFYWFIPYGTHLSHSAVSLRCGYAAWFLLYPQIIASFLYKGSRNTGVSHMKSLNYILQAGPPTLHYYCTIILHSRTVLLPVGQTSNHHYHCCQLKRHSSCGSNFYRTFKVFIFDSASYIYNYTK